MLIMTEIPNWVYSDLLNGETACIPLNKKTIKANPEPCDVCMYNPPGLNKKPCIDCPNLTEWRCMLP